MNFQWFFVIKIKASLQLFFLIITLTKYCSNSYFGCNGFTDNLTILQPGDDAATANWGSEARIPTIEEWQELLNNTTCEWTMMNGVYGRLRTASNGNSVFFPAAGSKEGIDIVDMNSGYYASSSLDTNYPSGSCGYYFGTEFYSFYGGYGRNSGQSVRAVRSARQN